MLKLLRHTITNPILSRECKPGGYFSNPGLRVWRHSNPDIWHMVGHLSVADSQIVYYLNSYAAVRWSVARYTDDSRRSVNLLPVLKLWKKKWRNAGSEAPLAPRRTPKFRYGRRREDRGAVGAEGREWGGGAPLPNRLGGLGSVVSSPSGVRGRAPADNEFGAFLWPLRTLILATICLISVFIKHCSCSLSLLLWTMQKVQ